jgi:TonB-linked SusC/RagA family outer membrane protein
MKSKFKTFLALFLVLFVQLIYAQEIAVTGTVTDQSGIPIPAANVVVKGTTTGTQTDIDGNFKIMASKGQKIVFSFLGMKNEEITVTSNTLKVKLTDASVELEGLVVTALGIKKKPDAVTTSTHLIKQSELNQAKATNAAVGLVGKVSGLQINTINNGVNPETRIQLRGFRSISGNNEALIVINNVVSNSTAFADLNPETIESVNVMKGANGAALYGSRGANGVIIVTTKRGNKSAEKFKVALNSTFTFESVAYIPQRQDRFGQGYEGAHDFTENTNWGPELDGSLQATGLGQQLYTYEARKNNIRDFFQTGNTALNSIAISSGDENGYVSFSLGNQKTEGIIDKDAYRKNNFNFSAGKTVGKLSVNGNLTYTTSNQNTVQYIQDGNIQGSLYSSLLQMPINIPVKEFSNGDQTQHWTYWELSPYWMIKNSRENANREIFDAVLDLNYKFNKNINTVLRANVRNFSNNKERFFNGYTQPVIYWDSPSSYPSSYYIDNSNGRSIYTDLLVNFDYDLTENLNLKANVGSNITDRKTNYIDLEGQNLVIPGLLNMSNITGNTKNSDEKTQRRDFSLLSNVDLGYKEYFFFNTTARRDYTSVLTADNRAFNYYSGGFSFIPTKAIEGLKGKVLNYAKLSASIVQVGNAGVDPYDINDRFKSAGTAGFPYASINSFVQDLQIATRKLKNEKTLSREANLNLGFLNNRITLDAGYYYSTNTDQILSISPSTASGANSAIVNIGSTKSTGFELDLGITPIKTNNITWDMRFSFSNPKTTVLKVSDVATDVLVGQPIGSIGVRAIEGEEFPMLVGFGYQRDPNGNIVIDAATGNPIKAANTKLGKTTPDYILGLNTSFKYKNLKISSVFDYRTGHVFYSGTAESLVVNGADLVTAETGREPFIFPNSVIQQLDGSYLPNTNVSTPGNQSYYTGIYRQIDENFVFDATAFKCREIAMSYEFPKKALGKSFISGLSIGLNMRNVFMILPKENRNYTDPEFSGTTGNNVGLSTDAQAPPTRTYGFNVNVTF